MRGFNAARMLTWLPEGHIAATRMSTYSPATCTRYKFVAGLMQKGERLR